MSARNPFIEIRAGTYLAISLSSIAVLGVAANFATLFLPAFHQEFIVFSLVVPAVTLLIILMVIQRSQPRYDAIVIFIMAVLWLSLASYATDFIGHVECEALGGQTTQTKGGTMSAMSYCRQLKVIMAFGWTNFAILALAFIVLLALIFRVQAQGRQYAWRDPIHAVPWFGAPGYYMPVSGGYPGQYPGSYFPMGAYPGQQGIVYQQPGASVIVQPTPGGPIVSQVPGFQGPPTIV